MPVRLQAAPGDGHAVRTVAAQPLAAESTCTWYLVKAPFILVPYTDQADFYLQKGNSLRGQK